jgi:hypothetical protein
MTLAGSFFDMALYPALFVAYLGHLVPALATGPFPFLLGLAMNPDVHGVERTRRARRRLQLARHGDLSLLGPFVIVSCSAVILGSAGVAGGRPRRARRTHSACSAASWWAMWNYMGWDNLSTIAGRGRPGRSGRSRSRCSARCRSSVLTYALPL